MASVIDIAKASILAFNEKDWNKMKAMMAPDAVYDEKATNRRLHGPAQIIEAAQGWATAFPDVKATFIREFAIGDTAVFEVVWKGTHTGPLQTPSGVIPASNRTAELPACEVIQVKGNKITNDSHYFDLLTLLTQIGVTAAPGQSRAA